MIGPTYGPGDIVRLRAENARPDGNMIWIEKGDHTDITGKVVRVEAEYTKLTDAVQYFGGVGRPCGNISVIHLALTSVISVHREEPNER